MRQRTFLHMWQGSYLRSHNEKKGPHASQTTSECGLSDQISGRFGCVHLWTLCWPPVIRWILGLNVVHVIGNLESKKMCAFWGGLKINLPMSEIVFLYISRKNWLKWSPWSRAKLWLMQREMYTEDCVSNASTLLPFGFWYPDLIKGPVVSY